MLQRILVPLDGSALADEAIELAGALARRRGAQIHLVSVHEPAAEWMTRKGMPEAVVESARAHDREQYEALAAHLRARLRDVVERFDVVARVSILEGDGPVAEQLATYVTTQGMDLIVMRTHGRGFVGRWWLGSVADHLLRLAVAPCLLLGRNAGTDAGRAPLPVGRILIPLDGAPASELAISQALAFAEPGRTVIQLVQIVPPMAWAVPSAPTMGLMIGQGIDLRLNSARAYLERVAERLRPQGFSVRTTAVCHPSPAAAILQLVDDERADLLAIAAPTRSGAERLLLGSVMERLVRHSPVPVLAWRGHPAAAEDAPVDGAAAGAATDATARLGADRAAMLLTPNVATPVRHAC